MKVRQLIEKLLLLPNDSEVEIVVPTKDLVIESDDTTVAFAIGDVVPFDRARVALGCPIELHVGEISRS